MKFTPSFRIASIITASIALAFTTACSTTAATSQKSVGLPVDSSPSVSSARVFTGGDKIYVTGRVHRTLGRPVASGAHVDVQLVDAHGRVIAEVQDAISPVHPRIDRLRNGQYPYTVSFPASELAGASKVVVHYHTTAHRS